MTTWFMTGASRGFGAELVEAALAAGDTVVGTARDEDAVRDRFPDASDALLALPLDVTDPVAAEAAVARAVETFGSVDVVVNNAGYGLFGAVEEISDPEARAVFETNVFGLLNMTRAVLPVLRDQGRGHVVNMGSSAGFAVGAGRGLYGASKFAVEAITEALHAELAPLGIRVTVVEPGSFRTGFLSGRSVRKARQSIEAYRSTSGALLDALDGNDGKQPGDPAQAARAIRALVASWPRGLVASDDPPLRLQLGSDSVALVEGKLDFVSMELAAWRETSLSTDHHEDA